MTAAELIAAGWEEYADGFSRGDWLIYNAAGPFFADHTYHAALTHNPPGKPSKRVCSHIASTREQALDWLAAVAMPDGRTVREWALSPPSTPVKLTAQSDMPAGTIVNRNGGRAKDNTEVYGYTTANVVKGEEFEPSFYGPVWVPAKP